MKVQRRIESLSLFVLIGLVALRPLVGESYDPAGNTLTEALGVVSDTTPLTTLVFDVLVLGSTCGCESIRIDQDVRRPRHTGSEMREYQVGPAELRRQLVGRRQLATHFPFFRADTVSHAAGFDGFEFSGFIGHVTVLLVHAIIHFAPWRRPTQASSYG